MPDTVGRDEVLALMSDGALVAEVLPREEYQWAHLPDAAHLPLKALDERSVEGIDRARPVVVYCNDYQ